MQGLFQYNICTLWALSKKPLCDGSTTRAFVMQTVRVLVASEQHGPAHSARIFGDAAFAKYFEIADVEVKHGRKHVKVKRARTNLMSRRWSGHVERNEQHCKASWLYHCVSGFQSFVLTVAVSHSAVLSSFHSSFNIVLK